MQQEANFSTEYIAQSTALLTGSETIRNRGDSSKFQSEDFGHEPSQPHCPIEFIDNEELELDSMWNDVCETLIAESSERKLRDWGLAEEKDSDQFEDIVENMTLQKQLIPHHMTQQDWIRGNNHQQLISNHLVNRKHCTPGLG